MYAGAAGLGRVYLGQPPGSIAGVGRWNLSSSLGKKDPAKWSVSRRHYSSANSKKLAEDIFRFQHDVQCLGGGVRPGGQRSVDVYGRDRVNCRNRDGMLGNATMCLIVQAIKTNMPHWGAFWKARLSLGSNTSKYSGNSVCRLSCREIACQYKRVVGCSPCSTPVSGEVREEDIIGDTVAAPPRRKPPARRKPPVRIPVPVVPGQIQTKSAGLGGGGLFLGALAIGGIWWLAKKRKNKR